MSNSLANIAPVPLHALKPFTVLEMHPQLLRENGVQVTRLFALCFQHRRKLSIQLNQHAVARECHVNI